MEPRAVSGGRSTVQHSIPWQCAVYTRRGASDAFVFSHVDVGTHEKLFVQSLSVQDLKAAQRAVRSTNLEALQDLTVMILVTGRWAQHVKLNTFTPTGGKYPAPVYTMYDHLERLCSARECSKHCSELSPDYRALQYHSTLCHYTPGGDHSWKLFSVIPMLSDTVILPRVLDPSRIKTTLASFSRAIRKCLRDSLIIAGTTKYRENAPVEKAGAIGGGSETSSGRE